MCASNCDSPSEAGRNGQVVPPRRRLASLVDRATPAEADRMRSRPATADRSCRVTVPSPCAASGVRTGTGGGCEGEAWGHGLGRMMMMMS